MKTGKKQFREFEESLRTWLGLLGCSEYDLCVEHAEADGAIASTSLNVPGCCGTVKFCKEAGEDPEPAATGLHEALHVLFARLLWMAEERFVSGDALRQEEERIVRILERQLREAE